MKTFRLFTILVALISTDINAQIKNSAIEAATSYTLKIMSWNIRIHTLTDTGLIYWNNRRDEVASLIKRYQPDILGVQEIRNMRQQKDLTRRLSEYDYVSYGRDNNKGTTGERLAILFNKNRFSVTEKGFFFLSESPDKATLGWDAAFNRICLWLKMYDESEKTSFFVFNTHFDHIGKLAREKSAALLAEKIPEIAGVYPVILTGDFNAIPLDKNFYTIITKNLTDSRTASKTKPTGTAGTFNGWNMLQENFSESVRIDYIFVNKMKVHSYRTINDKTTMGVYPSDHFPVLVKINMD